MSTNEKKRPRLSTIIACLALFIALGGTATAAKQVINGKSIKKGTITAKQIKNKSITKAKLKPATVKALKGNQGPQGLKGDTGATGAAGKDGVVQPIYKQSSSVNIPAHSELAIDTLNVPAGKYMITATSRLFSVAAGIMSCAVTANSGGGQSLSATWNSPGANNRTTVPMQWVTETATVTAITVSCATGDSNGSAQSTIIATPVQG